MGKLTRWLANLMGGQTTPAVNRQNGTLTDEQTIAIVRRRLEQQARRIAILDAQVDAQRARGK